MKALLKFSLGVPKYTLVSRAVRLQNKFNSDTVPEDF